LELLLLALRPAELVEHWQQEDQRIIPPLEERTLAALQKQGCPKKGKMKKLE
jgi:hypothetical protein